jgi:hypothetical protein
VVACLPLGDAQVGDEGGVGEVDGVGEGDGGKRREQHPKDVKVQEPARARVLHDEKPEDAQRDGKVGGPVD